MATLAGRIALVTGAGRGIGAATARRLAADGAAVLVADLDREPAEEMVAAIVADGGRAIGAVCDVTSGEQVRATVERCEQELGGLDILVTAAGILRDNLIHRMTEEEWDLVLDTHLKGTFLCAQAAQAKMVPRKQGAMVLLSSGSARGNRGQANYSAAKAGIEALGRVLAIELGRFNIRVNAVAPGLTETRMARSLAERTGVDYEDVKRNYAERVALGRIGQPEEIASVIAFLASDDANFVTGQTVSVRGAP